MTLYECTQQVAKDLRLITTGEATATVTWETGTFTATIYYSTTLTTTGAFDSGN